MSRMQYLNKKGKYISFVLIILGLVSLLMFATVSIAAADVIVKVNGKTLSFDQPPVVIEGRTLVPVRGIFEALGAKVTWQGETQTVIATKGGTTITLQVDNKEALKNTERIYLSVPPLIINSRVLVPLRFVGESLGANVAWDGEHETVRISNISDSLPTGNPTLKGDYNPDERLVLKAKLNASTDVEVILEPGALVKAAPVALYGNNALTYRLILGGDVITDSLPEKSGFDGARIKVIFIEQWPFSIKRPVVLANSEMINNRCWVGEKVIRSGVQIMERDTNILVTEASDDQWKRVEVLY